jgi:hypothetical protein
MKSPVPTGKKPVEKKVPIPSPSPAPVKKALPAKP